MGIARWLRRTFIQWLGPDEAAPETAVAAANSQVQATKALAARSIAAARRAESELAEALKDGTGDAGLRHLTEVLEEQSRLAQEHIAEYHRQQLEFVEALRELADSAEVERLNLERARLLDLRRQALTETEASQERLDQARGEAARLEALEALEAGLPLPAAGPARDEDPRERARLALSRTRLLDI